MKRSNFRFNQTKSNDIEEPSDNYSSENKNDENTLSDPEKEETLIRSLFVDEDRRYSVPVIINE